MHREPEFLNLIGTSGIDNPIHTRYLAPIDCLKISAQDVNNPLPSWFLALIDLFNFQSQIWHVDFLCGLSFCICYNDVFFIAFLVLSLCEILTTSPGIEPGTSEKITDCLPTRL